MLVVKYFVAVGLALTAALMALNAYLAPSQGSTTGGAVHRPTTASLPVASPAPAKPVANVPAVEAAPQKPTKAVQSSRHREHRRWH